MGHLIGHQEQNLVVVMFKQLLNDTLHLEQCNECILVTSDPLDFGWTCFRICMTIFLTLVETGAVFTIV